MLIAALAQSAATLLLAGIGATVQLVVYPAFGLVPAPAWPRYHAAHTRAITRVVAPPWVVQGLATAALLVLAPGSVLVWTVAALAAAGVALTVPAVGLHRRPDELARPDRLRLLLRVNLARTLAWTAGAVAGGLLIAANLTPGWP